MTKKFKTFEQLNHHDEKLELKPISKKQKSRFYDGSGKRKKSGNLKSHFPDRIWNKATENQKGRKV